MTGARFRLLTRAAGKGLIWCLIFGLELAVSAILFIAVKAFFIAGSRGVGAEDIQIAASAAHPQLVFACEMAADSLQSLFSNSSVACDLKELNAGVSLALIDLSPGRAQVVRQLNEADIPVTVWIALPKEQGYYLNAGNSAEAEARFADFEKWTADYGLRWAGVGLDIEPNLQEFAALRQGHPWRLASVLMRRFFDAGRVTRARDRYAALIRQMQKRGYRVETYQFPLIADQRKAHSTLLERLLGIVDVRGDREALMVYTSFNHAVDSAPIWKYGPDAQSIAIGVTAGSSEPGSTFGPLRWDEFSRDLAVASHFVPVVGVYSLEGCVRHGFLRRLISTGARQSVTVSGEAIRKVSLLRARVQTALWTGSNLPYFAAVILGADLWVIRRGRVRKRTAMK